MTLKQLTHDLLDFVSPRTGVGICGQTGSLKLDLLLVCGWGEIRH